ncbi:hypothetical protein PsorP6_002944 [Peronosclerospora sorghi]|uniref:Uncharacterized protein n=1 Tax=Peronosclerospora sorghi TaxID=230839 RepID=A0ACC0VMW9_9STRA|nr:hypothetical protein PsorP6_002944 [Peronosclerospora sorghi]
MHCQLCDRESARGTRCQQVGHLDDKLRRTRLLRSRDRSDDKVETRRLLGISSLWPNLKALTGDEAFDKFVQDKSVQEILEDPNTNQLKKHLTQQGISLLEKMQTKLPEFQLMKALAHLKQSKNQLATELYNEQLKRWVNKILLPESVLRNLKLREEQIPLNRGKVEIIAITPSSSMPSITQEWIC